MEATIFIFGSFRSLSFIIRSYFCLLGGCHKFQLASLPGEQIPRGSHLSFSRSFSFLFISNKATKLDINNSFSSRLEDGVKGQESQRSKFVGKAKEVELAMILEAVFIIIKLKLSVNIRNLQQEFFHHLSKVKHILDVLGVHSKLLQLCLYHLELCLLIQGLAEDFFQLVKLFSTESVNHLLDFLLNICLHHFIHQFCLLLSGHLDLFCHTSLGKGQTHQ